MLWRSSQSQSQPRTEEKEKKSWNSSSVSFHLDYIRNRNIRKQKSNDTVRSKVLLLVKSKEEQRTATPLFLKIIDGLNRIGAQFASFLQSQSFSQWFWIFMHRSTASEMAIHRNRSRIKRNEHFDHNKSFKMYVIWRTAPWLPAVIVYGTFFFTSPFDLVFNWHLQSIHPSNSRESICNLYWFRYDFNWLFPPLVVAEAWQLKSMKLPADQINHTQ